MYCLSARAMQSQASQAGLVTIHRYCSPATRRCGSECCVIFNSPLGLRTTDHSVCMLCRQPCPFRCGASVLPSKKCIRKSVRQQVQVSTLSACSAASGCHSQPDHAAEVLCMHAVFDVPPVAHHDCSLPGTQGVQVCACV